MASLLVLGAPARDMVQAPRGWLSPMKPGQGQGQGQGQSSVVQGGHRDGPRQIEMVELT